MFRNYFHTAVRSFLRNRSISAINLFGLALGLASCLVAVLYIKHELETDQFHSDIRSIFRMTVKLKSYDVSTTPYLLNEVLEKDYQDIQSTLRLSSEETSVRIGDHNFNTTVIFSDPQFFSFFSFPIQGAHPKSVLSNLKNVVISQEISEKYFSTDPLGKVIQIKLKNKLEDFQISAVAGKPAGPSSISFDFLIPLENNYPGGHGKDNWSNFLLTSFVRIDPEKLKTLESQMPAFIQKYIKRDEWLNDSLRFVFNPFAEHHLNNGYGGAALKEGTSEQNLYVFGGISTIILLLAAFNFMNLTNAQASRRVTEVGIRKVAGAARFQLVKQFLSEAIFVSLLAALLGLGLAELSLIIFRELLGIHLTVFDKNHVDVYIVLAAVTVLTGLLAGFYPSFILSNLTTLKSFKRNFSVGGYNLLTRSVLVFQFFLSIVLMVGAIAMWNQQKFLMEKDLGFNKEQLLVIPVAEQDTVSAEIVKQRLIRETDVINVAKSSGAFTRGNSVSVGTMPDQSRIFIYMQRIDEEYLETMQMKIVKGRNFTELDPRDNSKIIVNEALVKKFNLEDSISQRLGRAIGFIQNPTIIGVVGDFNHSPLRSRIEPMMLLNSTQLDIRFLMIRTAPGKVATVLEKAKKIWEASCPDTPFDFFFLDQDLAQQYASEKRWSGIITVGTGMAIFLSVLGLVGLALYTAERRKKEIGIRKVLGASIRQLLGLLSKDYVILVCLAFFIAVPVSYYMITNYWLNNFAYHVEVSFIVYVVALAAIMAIAITAIGSQTISAALKNPAEVLKEE
jgi:putative ABC transport system permease protein